MRIFLYFVSAVFVVNSIVLTGRKSFTLGLAIMVAIAAVSFILARYFDFWVNITKNGIGMVMKYILLFSLVCFVFLAGYVLSYAHSTVNHKEDAIIVLGCGLNKDGTPSHTLQNRLDGCIDYHSKNPGCIIVVTGAVSRFGNFTEASSMKKYLVENGVPADNILTEEKATNTKENFEYSLELLHKKDLSENNIAFITNSFHIFRATNYASQAGFNDINALSVKTDRAVFLPAVIREVCAVAAQMFFKY